MKGDCHWSHSVPGGLFLSSFDIATVELILCKVKEQEVGFATSSLMCLVLCGYPPHPVFVEKILLPKVHKRYAGLTISLGRKNIP